MNILIRPLILSATLLSLVGCGKENASPTGNNETAVHANHAAAAAPVATATPTATAAPAASASKAARVVEVNATDAMKFSVTRIEAKPGEELQIKLTNVGTLPKEAMGHNLVLLKKDANPQTYSNAALTAKAQEYLPPSLSDQVIAATKLLGPKQSDTITFKVPQEAGEYPYICSFPAHFVAGMKGVLVVKE